MPKHIIIAAICTFLLSCNMLVAQTQPAPALKDVLEAVTANHPVAQQSRLFGQSAQAELLKAKGGFDPKLYGDYQGKIFKDKTYFSIGEYGAKLPTWGGLELKAGYGTASGTYLNPENTLPANGQAIAGLAWTLGRGLLIDDRRADLSTARLGLGMAEQERNILLNDLLFESAKYYWSWAVACGQAYVTRQALDRAQLRLAGIRESYLQGDKPAIDTIEALVLVQNRQLDWNENLLDARNYGMLLLSMMQPGARLSVDTLQCPASLFFDSTAVTALQPIPVVQVSNQHPALQMTSLKLAQLDVERRLKRENLKPQVDLSYYLLGSGWQFAPYGGESVGNIVGNNVKFGVQFGYAIPNRKARGDLQKTQIKITATNAYLAQKSLELNQKLRIYQNEYNNLLAQVRLCRSMMDNYNMLLEGEQAKFGIGESSVFLVNTREQKWLEARLKWIKLLGELEKARLGIVWAQGGLR